MRIILALTSLFVLLLTVALSLRRPAESALFLAARHSPDGIIVEDLYRGDVVLRLSGTHLLVNRWLGDNLLLNCTDTAPTGCASPYVVADLSGRLRPLVRDPANAYNRSARFDTTSTLAFVQVCVDPACLNDERYIVYDVVQNRQVATLDPIASITYIGERFMVYLGFQQPDGTRPLYYADAKGARQLYAVPPAAQMRVPENAPLEWIYIRADSTSATENRLLRVNIHSGDVQTLVMAANGLSFSYFGTAPNGDTVLLQQQRNADLATLLHIAPDGRLTTLFESVAPRGVLHDAAGGHTYAYDADQNLWHVRPDGVRYLIGALDIAPPETPVMGLREDGQVYFRMQVAGGRGVVLYNPRNGSVRTYSAGDMPPGVAVPDVTPGAPELIWDTDLAYQISGNRILPRPVSDFPWARDPNGQRLAYVHPTLNTLNIADAAAGVTRLYRPLRGYNVNADVLDWTQHGVLFRALPVPEDPIGAAGDAYLMTPDGSVVRPVLLTIPTENCPVGCLDTVSGPMPRAELEPVWLGVGAVLGLVVVAVRVVVR